MLRLVGSGLQDYIYDKSPDSYVIGIYVHL